MRRSTAYDAVLDAANASQAQFDETIMTRIPRTSQFVLHGGIRPVLSLEKEPGRPRRDDPALRLS